MGDIMKAIEFIGIPTTIAICIIVLFLITQIIGELAEAMGKIVPEILKIRKYFSRKKKEKAKEIKEREETAKTLKEVKKLLGDVNSHYSVDNITKRDDWMDDVNTDRDWMHKRADTYDQSIIEIKNSLLEVANQLRSNTEMTEDMFIENSRDRIIDFAEKASNHDVILSHEQFRRIFRVYDEYERFLKERNRTNGEVDIAYEMIQDGFKYRMQNHCFAEDLKGYSKK